MTAFEPLILQPERKMSKIQKDSDPVGSVRDERKIVLGNYFFYLAVRHRAV